jgi:hypothetical protein
MFDPNEVERMVRSLATGGGNADDARILLTILMLEVWLATYLPRAVPPGMKAAA